MSLRALAKPDLAAASLELVVDPTKKVDEKPWHAYVVPVTSSGSSRPLPFRSRPI